MLGQLGSRFDSDAVDEYWKAYATQEHRRGLLELFRSGDFTKLAPYAGMLGALGVPTLVLCGEHDEYAPLDSAHRFDREIPQARLVVVNGAGHFVWEDDPERCTEEILVSLEKCE